MIGKLCIVATLCAGMASAQVNRATPASKPLAFEVVSIRQNVAGGEVEKFGATPDGFRMVNMPLGRVMLTAYVPQSGAAFYWGAAGSPDWMGKDRYDIEAKVAQDDLAEWQKPASQEKMLRAMLQALLAERCKLVVHRELKDAKVYYLEVGKGGPRFGPKFKEAKADETDPAGQPKQFPSGGLVVPEGEQLHFYRAPLTLLATFLTNRNMDGPEIQDRTGLTGRYDMVVEWGAWTGGMGSTDGTVDPGPTMFPAVGALGLKLELAKGQIETLVLDHVERPSQN